MIFIDDKTIKIGGVILPGIIKNLEIDTEILYDEIEVEGRADKPKQVTGYADGKIYIDLSLHGATETEVMQKLNIVQSMFKNINKTPYAYTIVNKHINARKIDLVVLKKITTKESSGTGFNLMVNIELFEYIPIVVQTIKTQNSNTNIPAQSKENSDVARSSGALKTTNKTSYSPATENYLSAKKFNNEYKLAL